MWYLFTKPMMINPKNLFSGANQMSLIKVADQKILPAHKQKSLESDNSRVIISSTINILGPKF